VRIVLGLKLCEASLERAVAGAKQDRLRVAACPEFVHRLEVALARVASWNYPWLELGRCRPPSGEGGVHRGCPGACLPVIEDLMVEQMSQLVQEAER
jgi:hypothetical protein